jgi:hypothetical protein
MRGALTLLTWFLVVAWIFLALSLLGLTVASTVDHQLANRLWDDYGNMMPLSVPFIVGLVLIPVLLVGIILCRAGLDRCARARRPVEKSTSRPDEARILEEIHQGLLRMDQRVEALETILLERKTEARHL